METKNESSNNRWYNGCGIGWKTLIEPIINYIQSHNEKCCNDEEKIEIHQVKEKFGGLRIYTSNTTKELEDMILKAESESYKTCEMCGTKDNVGQIMTGWIKTCCRKCAGEIAKTRNGSVMWREKGGYETMREIKRREE